MPKQLDDTIAEELLSLEATAQLTLQRIQKLRLKMNSTAPVKKKGLSAEQSAQLISKRRKRLLK